MLEKVVFSERAIISLLSETQEHIHTETGGVFLGHRCEKIWYIVEAVDPGINCIFQPAYFEYDDVYLNHLMNKIDRLYKVPLELMGLWHRHPGSFDQFSGTDDGTNIKYARKHADGAISALVNIDPTFRITMYHVTDPLNYRKVKYSVGDKLFPPEYLAYANRKKYLNLINYSGGKQTGFLSKFIRGKNINSHQESELYLDESMAKKFSFSNILHEFLDENKTRESSETEHTTPQILSDEEIDTVIDHIQTDLDYFEETGINVTLTILPSGGMELKEKSTLSIPTPISITIFIKDGLLLFNYNERTYEYYSGMFKEACEYYTLLGGATDESFY